MEGVKYVRRTERWSKKDKENAETDIILNNCAAHPLLCFVMGAENTKWVVLVD